MRCSPSGRSVGRRRLLGFGLAGLALGAGATPALGATPASAATPSTPGAPGAPAPDTPAPAPEAVAAWGRQAATVAAAQIGVPYAWGGGDRLGASIGFCDEENGYLNGQCLGENTVGFDCSGLALFCWYRASGGAVDLAHYTVAQYHRSAPVAARDLLPGDLLFFSRPDAPLHHVGVYAGGGAMIHAERTGTLVARLSDVLDDPRWAPEFAGGRRPLPLARPA
ncbi:NlpC/P60 family protein [Kitasatospora sp. CM 4170]|uniref:C40 family peptidase n=1 Tax=Kitasatospora aburaviensis TaxID=67265 RepID=A0ABW1EX68_9ACTN|nr:NlpC/P60 family protein [Kitasatospora sp. CM 4170]WNM43805.1 NlpC/P60 family protein [Kitasatospora sp. CM 4170]